MRRGLGRLVEPPRPRLELNYTEELNVSELNEGISFVSSQETSFRGLYENYSPNSNPL